MPGPPSLTDPQRHLILVTSDAIARNTERGDWARIALLGRSIVRTANEALRLEQAKSRGVAAHV